MKISKIADVSEYIATFPAPVRAKLKKIRAIVRKNAPGALEKMSYGMPAYSLNGVLVYFNAFEKHIGIYIMPSAIPHFQKEIAGYSTSKGTIRLPLEGRLPEGLIARIVRFRVKENAAKKNQSAASYHRAKKKARKSKV